MRIFYYLFIVVILSSCENDKKCCIVDNDLSPEGVVLKVDSRPYIPAYRNSNVVKKVIRKEMKEFMLLDSLVFCRSAKFSDTLFVVIDSFGSFKANAIYIKIYGEDCQFVVRQISDFEGGSRIYSPQESVFHVSSEEYSIGDTLVGELSLVYKEASQKIIFNGTLACVVEEFDNDWRKYVLSLPSQACIFDYLIN